MVLAGKKGLVLNVTKEQHRLGGRRDGGP